VEDVGDGHAVPREGDARRVVHDADHDAVDLHGGDVPAGGDALEADVLHHDGVIPVGDQAGAEVGRVQAFALGQRGQELHQ